MEPYQKGTEFFACGTPVIVAENEQGETHVYRASDRKQLTETDLKFGTVFGGFDAGTVTEDTKEKCSSVTMESGFLWMLCGGGKGQGTALSKAEVRLHGGVVGGYLHGAGLSDTVGKVGIVVDGGTVKWGLYGGGEALSCGQVELNFAHIVCTNVSTGTRNKAGRQTGGASVYMKDGIVLNIYCGGKGVSVGNASVTVKGGRIEKQIADLGQQGNIDITLWDGIFMDGSNGKRFPMLPERAALHYIDGGSADTEALIAKGTAAAQREKADHIDRVLDRTDEDGKLVFRFFELRDPAAPEASAFPEFIGDSFLISFPNGCEMLVDTGMPYAADEILRNLKALHIRKLDYIVITHQHSDHNGSLPQILREFAVGELIFPDATAPTDAENAAPLNEAIPLIVGRHIPVRPVHRGETLRVGDTEILFLNPERHGVYTDPNDGSVAMKVSFGQSSAVLGADIGERTEVALTDLYGEKLRCDLLKASHHGIVYQNHYRYIDACRPKYMAFHSLRPQGVFLRTTRLCLQQVNRMTPEQICITGEKGAMKFVLDGAGGITTAFQYDET